jgi:hypothetical protein
MTVAETPVVTTSHCRNVELARIFDDRAGSETERTTRPGHPGLLEGQLCYDRRKVVMIDMRRKRCNGAEAKARNVIGTTGFPLEDYWTGRTRA